MSAWVKVGSEQLSWQETEVLKRQEAEIRAQISEFNAFDRLSREELHDRER